MFQVENAMCDLRKKQQREKRAERSERVKREEGREQRGKSAERRRTRETSRFAPGASSEGLPPRNRDTHGLRHAELRQTNRIVARQVLPPMLPEHQERGIEEESSLVTKVQVVTTWLQGTREGRRFLQLRRGAKYRHPRQVPADAQQKCFVFSREPRGNAKVAVAAFATQARDDHPRMAHLEEALHKAV